MTPRSLFTLVLKIIGILFIWNILEAFSRTLSVLVYLPQYDSEKEAIFNLGVTIPPLVLYTLFSWAMIFRTGTLIDLLKLDRNTAPGNIGVRLHRSVILSVAVIATGGWMLVSELPEFFRHAVYYVQERKLYSRMARPDLSYLVMSAMKLLIGLLLIMFNRFIVNVIEVKRKSRTSAYWPIKKTTRKKLRQPVED